MTKRTLFGSAIKQLNHNFSHQQSDNANVQWLQKATVVSPLCELECKKFTFIARQQTFGCVRMILLL